MQQMAHPHPMSWNLLVTLPAKEEKKMQPCLRSLARAVQTLSSGAPSRAALRGRRPCRRGAHGQDHQPAV